MSIWQLLVGIALVIFTISMVIVSIARTPDHLRGWYGLMFWTIAIGGIVGGAVLICNSFIPLIG